MLKTEPWIESNDSFIEYYGLLTENELEEVKEMFYIWCNEKPILSSQTILKEHRLNLLDFSDYESENQFSLFEKLCGKLKSADSYLYWFPLSSRKEQLFDDYDPVMVAKTTLDAKYLALASASFMQMLNGGLMVVDSKKRFIAIIVDGYYMIAAVKKGILDSDSIQYIHNWNIVEEKLDSVTASILLDK